ncbi:MAG: hypothetical protein R3E55_02500 [Burkholderiaceae bacterium]
MSCRTLPRPCIFARTASGGAVLAVIAGLVVVAASTLAIRMARQVEARTELQQVTQARMQRIQAALHAFAASQGGFPVQPMVRRTRGWRCLLLPW